MNKSFYIILVVSILAIVFASVYLINRKPAPMPFSNQPSGFTQIYAPKPGGRVFTAMDTSGENCATDGIRFNIANEHTLVDRESTWIFTLNNNPAPCTDKPWWSPKIGSEGKTGQASGLYEASVPYDGGFHLMRTEGPFLQYHSCSGYEYVNVPAMPQGKPIGIKTASWRIPDGVHVEFWYDFTGGGHRRRRQLPFEGLGMEVATKSARGLSIFVV